MTLSRIAAYNEPCTTPNRRLPMNSPKPRQFVQSRMLSGPIRNESLSDELLEVIGKVHRKIGKYLGMNLEQFEIGFMRAESPETEVAIWKSIAMAWDKFHRQYVGRIQLPHDEQKSLIAALVAISMGVQKPELLGVPITVGKCLLACYDDVLGL
jgi:hypothetical protein